MSAFQRARLYFDTLRYLKFEQIWGRFIFRLRRPEPDLRNAPSIRSVSGSWSTPAARRVSMHGESSFHFLNRDGELAETDTWTDASNTKLWLYNLHYFDDLNAENAVQRSEWHKKLVERWIEENPPGSGAGWEPYPLSLRVVNWLKWALNGNSLGDVATHSLAVQVRYLRKRLEHHLLGNHLFVNAKALVFAGCFFEGDEAKGWLECGLGILSREVPEQILSDGGHFERSTMYHALAYEDMLDLMNLAVAYPKLFNNQQALIDNWRDRIEHMGYWLSVMCHPDEDISFFNDAAIGISPSPRELFYYVKRLGFPIPRVSNRVEWLKESGYVRVQQGSAVLLVDVAPLGPDYLPAHGHADTLSYEFSVYEQRLVVNSGTSRYGLGAEREYERSTAAHSTLELNGQNSSEVWAGFRVARRAYPTDVSVREEGGAVVIEAAHDGYLRLPGRPVHRRRWVFSLNKLEVYDWVDGKYEQAVSRVYVHPEIKVGHSNESGSFCWGDKEVSWRVDGAVVSIQHTDWHPEFGVSVANNCLEMSLSAGAESRLNFGMEW